MSLRWASLGLLAALALALAGCGGEAPSATGSATLWITRDRGTVQVSRSTVPAGQSLLRALRSRARVETRFGGRFVQAIDGVAGDARRQRDWFWFVNGLAGDRSAAEYRLRPGDVAWWDYRSWARDAGTLEVVAGAFPEPFLHGYDGTVRGAAVRYAAGLERDARRVGRALRTGDVAPLAVPAAPDRNLFELVRGNPRLRAALRTPGGGPAAAVRFTFAGDVRDLLRGRYRMRFAWP